MSLHDLTVNLKNRKLYGILFQWQQHKMLPLLSFWCLLCLILLCSFCKAVFSSREFVLRNVYAWFTRMYIIYIEPFLKKYNEVDTKDVFRTLSNI